MRNMELRERRIKVFEETLRICEWEKELIDSIEIARRNIILRNKMAKERKEDKTSSCNVGVLFLMQFPQLGGNVIRGGEGWVETLCRSTTLYPCLDTDCVRQFFYQQSRASVECKDTETGVYIPRVICLKKDGDSLDMLSPERRFLVDMIGYASAGDIDIDRSMDVMFELAKEQGLEVLVIGVSQYCSMGYTQKDVIDGMQTALQKYPHCFQAVHLIL